MWIVVGREGIERHNGIDHSLHGGIAQREQAPRNEYPPAQMPLTQLVIEPANCCDFFIIGQLVLLRELGSTIEDQLPQQRAYGSASALPRQ